MVGGTFAFRAPSPGGYSGGMIEQRAFRDSLGQFGTGVAVVASRTATGEPVGFAAQSFSALSLDPPLVLFCPAKTSRTWPHIAATRHFAISVLAADQRAISHRFAGQGDDKFAGVAWTPADNGAPTIDGALTYFACSLERVEDGGDHHIVIGRVIEVGENNADAAPLLFHRGEYLTPQGSLNLVGE